MVPFDTAARLAAATHVLPGLLPYENHRPVVVPQEAGGQTLLEILCLRFPHIPRDEWRERCAAGRFIHPGGRILAETDRLAASARITQIFPNCTEPPVATDLRVVAEDETLLVLDKPAPLPMHPSGRFNRNTLHYFLRQALGAAAPLPVHRLDANTTGLVLFAKTPAACHAMQRQFASGAMTKIYQVRACGHPPEDEFEVALPISAKPGATGTHGIDVATGRAAVTRFRVLRRDADGTSLLEARLETGRTNQIRIHLWAAGHPVVGDPAYLADGRIGGTQTLDAAAAPMCLHAHRLAGGHPSDGRLMEFVSQRIPAWLERP